MRALTGPLVLEVMMITVNELMDRAIHPNTWFSWIPEDIVERIPHDQKVSVSNVEGNWVIADTSYKVIYSDLPIEIVAPTPEEVKLLDVLKLFAKVLPAIANNPTTETLEDPEPPAPRVA